MIKKIISGGQTGVDQAALDVAIKLDIQHGGWIPKGRKTEDGPLPDKYQLQEMTTSSYPKRTEKNVIDSDGTLIISHGKLTGGSVLTRKIATFKGRPWLHIDLNMVNAFDAANIISPWIGMNDIEILNVAGSRASKDSGIYRATTTILEAAITLASNPASVPESFRFPPDPPRTIKDALEKLVSDLSLKEKTEIANLEEPELSYLNISLGSHIRYPFGLWCGNDELMESCRSVSGEKNLHEDDSSIFIIKELWKKLRKTYGLRVVK